MRQAPMTTQQMAKIGDEIIARAIRLKWPRCRGWRCRLWLRLSELMGMSQFVNFKLLSAVRAWQDGGRKEQ